MSANPSAECSRKRKNRIKSLSRQPAEVFSQKGSRADDQNDQLIIMDGINNAALETQPDRIISVLPPAPCPSRDRPQAGGAGYLSASLEARG
jgi:hypothetical protein